MQCNTWRAEWDKEKWRITWITVSAHVILKHRTEGNKQSRINKGFGFVAIFCFVSYTFQVSFGDILGYDMVYV